MKTRFLSVKSDVAITPNSSVCSTCHVSDLPRQHMVHNGGDFEATIQRSLWGMEYGLPGIPDDIRLLIQVEAVKQDS